MNEQFKRKMNRNMRGNRKLFLNEISKANGEKVESCSRIKDWSSAMGKDAGRLKTEGLL